MFKNYLRVGAVSAFLLIFNPDGSEKINLGSLVSTGNVYAAEINEGGVSSLEDAVKALEEKAKIQNLTAEDKGKVYGELSMKFLELNEEYRKFRRSEYSDKNDHNGELIEKLILSFLYEKDPEKFCKSAMEFREKLLVVEEKKNKIDAYREKALTYLDKSKTAAVESIILNPDGPDGYIALAAYYVHFGVSPSTLREFETIGNFLRNLDKTNPKAPQALNVLGVWYEDGNTEKAMEFFNKALEIDPGYKPAQHNLEALKLNQLFKKLDIKVEGRPELEYVYP